jgi:hypothetical protein
VSPVSWSNGVGTATVRVTTPYHADRVTANAWWYGLSASSNTFNVV